MTLLRVLAALGGTVLLLLGVAAHAHARRLAALPPYRRPPATWHPLFPLFSGVLIIGLHLAGLALLAAASPWLALAFLLALAVRAAARAARAREAPARRRVLAELVRWERERAAEDTAERRVAFVLARHPEWGTELAGQIVADCAEADDLARWIVKLEHVSSKSHIDENRVR
ncbi:MAG: hypothetical protein KBD01_04755 [Acidobacteria bacterium]|nr:hypothetical protein [Acidobacteriota bacterium]